MTSFLPTALCCLASIVISDGLHHSFADSPCGDWTPYKNEKCIKFVVRSGLQTKEDGEVVCKAFTEEFHGDDTIKLATIKTQEQQNFLQKLLFEDLGNLDNVWLGLELETDDVFRWNDGSELFFTNWIEEPGNAADRRCVQMESGEGAYERGKWVRANCKKKNAVVCERTQPWSVAAFQNIVMNLKLEVARNKEEQEQLNQEIASLKQNPVPIGFIYVQLPGQHPPTTLWPQTSWKDVGSDYAGLFFRVEGGDAAPFGQLQGDNTRRLAQVYNNWNIGDVTNPLIPADGSWSQYAASGREGGNYQSGLRFRLTTGEVRPRNKSVKIWQRIKYDFNLS